MSSSDRRSKTSASIQTPAAGGNSSGGGFVWFIKHSKVYYNIYYVDKI
ncbi:hypothetical protein HMPREF1992_00815 [Selenomonas sp. oral taxon 892 str. F0426]|nr:hypothetical protein HMPREF1992_00815 [Selenomonas sp. oral taxon 892 str. F0426]